MSLSPTTLGSKCANHYRHTVFCSELTKYRSIDGSCNHPHHPAWGQALTAYKRLLPARYDDGKLNNVLNLEEKIEWAKQSSFKISSTLPVCLSVLCLVIWNESLVTKEKLALSKVFNFTFVSRWRSFIFKWWFLLFSIANNYERKLARHIKMLAS